MKFNPPFKSLNEKTFFIMEEKTMKKLSRIAALLAATALLLGAFGCSSGGGSGNSDDNSDDDDQELEDDYTGKTTTGSWNFVSQADTVEWVAAFKTNTITNTTDGTLSLDNSGDISIESDALSADTDGLTLTILAAKPWSGATNPNYSYAEPASGLRIKNPALKIADVKGKVKVTIEWACISGKPANDRKLQLLKDGGTVVKEKNNDATGSTTTDMTTFEATVAAGEGTNLYIGGDNNVFIKSVKVEAASASDVVETPGDVTPPENETPSEEEPDDDEEYLGDVITLSALDWEGNLAELSAKTNWPSKSGFAIVASSSNKVTVEVETDDASKYKKVQLEGDTETIKNRIKMGGAVKSDGRYIEMPLEGACKISIWALGGGASNTGRCVQIATAAAPTTNIKKSAAVAGTSNTIEAVTIKMSDEDIARSTNGLFALSGDAGINIYYITIQYKE